MLQSPHYESKPFQPTRHPLFLRGEALMTGPPVPVNPEMVRWARERANLKISDLPKTLAMVKEWEEGVSSPTAKQLEDFAERARVPFDYLFLAKPPKESLPINDFRTHDQKKTSRPSSYLLDTIHTMRRRSAWLRKERIHCRVAPIKLVGSASLRDNPKEVAHNMREALGLADGWASHVEKWEESITTLSVAIEKIGIMAVINGVVGNSANMELNTDEFLGFALCDEYAPLIFVNGTDYEVKKTFTLAHELAHVWLGAAGEGLSLTDIKKTTPNHEVEKFCSKAAVEFLVPADELRRHWDRTKGIDRQYKKLAKIFKVSPVVIGRCALDEGLITHKAFLQFYNYRITEGRKISGGGGFYKTQNARVGAKFITQLYHSAMEGRIELRDAYKLTCLTEDNFHRYLQLLGLDNT